MSFFLIFLCIVVVCIAAMHVYNNRRERQRHERAAAVDSAPALHQRQRAVMDKIGKNRIKRHFTESMPAHIRIPQHAQKVVERLTENLPSEPIYGVEHGGEHAFHYTGEVNLDRLNERAERLGIPSERVRPDLRQRKPKQPA